MPTPLLGDRPLTNAAKQARQRERDRLRMKLGNESMEFILNVSPGRVPAGELEALQRKIKAMLKKVQR